MALRDYKPGDEVTGFFAVRKKELKEYNGRFFLKLELGDASGRMDGILWEEAAVTHNQLEIGSAVKVRGAVTTYRDDLQINIQKVRPAAPGEYALEELLPRSKFSKEELEKKFADAAAKIKNPHLKKLLDLFSSERKVFDVYLTVPAGKLWHHNYIGGLAEHSLQMADIARQVAPYYPLADADLLAAGALLHDCGKVWQYKTTGYIDYTTEGRLVGHINSGDHYVADLIARLPDFPAELALRLRHLVVAHQGELEKGSPVVPQTPEGFILYAIDEMDSKMGALNRIWEKEKKSGWSEYINLIGRYIYWGENLTQK